MTLISGNIRTKQAKCAKTAKQANCAKHARESADKGSIKLFLLLADSPAS